MLSLSKENSTIIKGIVISMMLAYHLFNRAHIGLCEPLLYIGDKPFISWLIRACAPVAFFMLLSGYGLAYKYSHGGLNFKSQFNRILRLYIHFWIILTLFLLIGHIIKPLEYPGSIKRIWMNFTSWSVSYNAEMWFLLPYAIISLMSLYIFKVLSKFGDIKTLIATVVINVITSLIISRYGSTLYTHHLIYNILLCFHLLVSFVTGAVLYRTKVKLNWAVPQWGILLLITALVIITCITPGAVRYIIYSPLLVILLAHVQWPKYLKNILLELGRKSMPMWMIHTWLAYYLFQPQVYSLKYVPVIFIAVLVSSYIISIPVMWIADKIIRLLPKMS